MIKTRAIEIAVRLFEMLRGNPTVRGKMAALKGVPVVRAVYWRFDSLSRQYAQRQLDVRDLSERAQRIYEDLKPSQGNGHSA
jgi:hypothetical protein